MEWGDALSSEELTADDPTMHAAPAEDSGPGVKRTVEATGAYRDLGIDHLRFRPVGPGRRSLPDAAPTNREPVGQYLVGISFDHELSATEFSVVLQRLHQQERLHLLDLVVITCDDQGHTRVHESADPSMPTTALGGALWGSLIGLLLGGPIGWVAGSAVGAASGALTAKFVDIGVPDEWVAWFSETIERGATTLVVLVERLDDAALATELRRFPGARVVHTTLPDHVEARLVREALACTRGDEGTSRR